ncbi:EscU/YscU/HrcU family type III secretion system export apparatus switch protein [Peribacillus asahii]|uniref:EscU/YscU/HrcU family type III secretion system export apparatus switch protein n=1 Tax=Peribacillus asahii TaxID=228899 RepID=UPI00207A3404|nr:EscU/YscU/HrcU family type III secretion system export apparatus switch protein [Peribacillus asahii]USK61197.1 EscU/YscU/HrcU family type III secretion system export apparatus switch protein [Peribacillus asahii]
MMEDKRAEAIALKYDSEKDPAPKVLAKGKGKVAENILEKAKELNIPVQKDPSLVELLGKLDINETIPDELYRAVAEVFAFIYKMDRDAESRKKLF